MQLLLRVGTSCIFCSLCGKMLLNWSTFFKEFQRTQEETYLRLYSDGRVGSINISFHFIFIYNFFIQGKCQILIYLIFKLPC